MRRTEISPPVDATTAAVFTRITTEFDAAFRAWLRRLRRPRFRRRRR